MPWALRVVTTCMMLASLLARQKSPSLALSWPPPALTDKAAGRTSYRGIPCHGPLGLNAAVGHRLTVGRHGMLQGSSPHLTPKSNSPTNATITRCFTVLGNPHAACPGKPPCLQVPEKPPCLQVRISVGSPSSHSAVFCHPPSHSVMLCLSLVLFCSSFCSLPTVCSLSNS